MAGELTVEVTWIDWDGHGKVTITHESGSITLDMGTAVDELNRVVSAIEEERTSYGQRR